MTCDLLLYWMSHKAEGSWAGFKKAVSELVPNSSEDARVARRMRIALSDLCHADFFVDESARWRVLSPMLAGLAGRRSLTVLTGARTPELIHTLQSAASEAGCGLSVNETGDAPTRVELSGEHVRIERVAGSVGIPYVPDLSVRLIQRIVPVGTQVENAAHEDRPHQWGAEHFDLKQRIWVQGLQPNSACRFTPRNGPQKFLLHRRHRKFLQFPKREAVYASAMLQGIKLLSYEPLTEVLSVPIAAPLPAELARIASLCSGTQPHIADGNLMYQTVPFEIAAAILVAAGQTHPGMLAIAHDRRGSLG